MEIEEVLETPKLVKQSTSYKNKKNATIKLTDHMYKRPKASFLASIVSQSTQGMNRCSTMQDLKLVP